MNTLDKYMMEYDRTHNRLKTLNEKHLTSCTSWIVLSELYKD